MRTGFASISDGLGHNVSRLPMPPPAFVARHRRRMFSQSDAKPNPNAPAWLVWRAFHDGYNAAIYYEALPESHEAKRGWVQDPIELKGEDRNLSLSELAAKYPPLRER